MYEMEIGTKHLDQNEEIGAKAGSDEISLHDETESVSDFSYSDEARWEKALHWYR